MINPDLPIKSCAEEKKYGLDRCKFAQSLGNIILNYDKDESLVIGLDGEWGSGKTSIANMIREYLEKEQKELAEDETLIQMKFNPWNFHEQNQLILQFFHELIITLKNHDVGKDIIGMVKSYASKLTITSAVLIGGFFRPGTTKVYLDYFSSNESENETIDSLRDKLDELLKKERKIIIFIEDIDRLNKTEIRQILQLVKLSANFPNIIYFLEFDKKVIEKALQNHVPDENTSQYIEKIVQVIYPVPKFSDFEIELILNTEIDDLIIEDTNKFNRNNWALYYDKGLKYLFKDIRSIKRYMNTLKLSYELLKNEVVLEDLFAITAIQLFLPDLYNTIKNNKRRFAFGLKDILSKMHGTSENKQDYRIFFDEIFDKFSNEKISKNSLKNLLTELFPIISHIYDEKYSEIIHNEIFSLCSPNSFEIYFRLSVPGGEISRAEFDDLISKMENSSTFKDVLVEYKENGKIIKFLKLLLIYVNHYPTKFQENASNIITALLDKGDLFPPNDTVPNEDPTITIINGIVLRLFDSCQNNIYTILKNAITESQDSLYTFIVVLKTLQNTIDDKEFEQLTGIVCKKIENWAADGKLINHRDSIDILYFWNKYGNSFKVDKFITKTIKDNESLIKFTKTFFKDNGVIKYSLDGFVKEIIDITGLKWRLKTIISSNSENLTEKQIKLIKQLLKTVP